MTAAPEKSRYFFGRTLATRIDMFAYPRTGSHFFRYCTQGLFDLVAIPGPAVDNAEAIDRQRELEPDILYALDLREDGVPYQPVWFNATAGGEHGTPVATPFPRVILAREPIATVYSGYRVARDRPDWPQKLDADLPTWLGHRFRSYHRFCTAASVLLAAEPDRTFIVRFDELRASPELLERLVAFVGVTPKLRPSLVHRLTRFDTIARPGERTFYRSGDDDAHRRDDAFTAAIASMSLPDFSPFAFVPQTTR
jgi:hypothetical protein